VKPGETGNFEASMKSKTKTLIHATFADGTTMLFSPREKVWVCDWMDESGEYFSGEKHGFAEDLIKPKYHVIDPDGYGPKVGLTNA
jgi:hypothetical protein